MVKPNPEKLGIYKIFSPTTIELQALGLDFSCESLSTTE